MHIQYRSLGTERFCHRKSVNFVFQILLHSTEQYFWYEVEDTEHESFKTFLNVALDITNNLLGNLKCKFKSIDFILLFTSLYYWRKTHLRWWMHDMKNQNSKRWGTNWQGTWFHGFHFDSEACPGCVRLLTVESDQEWGRLSCVCLTVGSRCRRFTAYSKITNIIKYLYTCT